MRGEYKVSGGKLVAVDVDVDDGKLANVSISGDFFLEPDTVIDDLNDALNGMPADSSVADMAAAIERAAGDAELIGFTPDVVGIAVRRALGKAVSWHDLTFDVIHRAPMNPAMHVALDQVLPGSVAKGEREAALVIWEWDDPLVVIGSFQSYKNEIDQEALERHGMRVVRRITGGGAMFMEAGNCITYSLIVPTALVEGLSFEQSYAYLDEWVIAALKKVGVNARYVPLNDIASDKGKIGGAAQKRFIDGSMVHHVTMSYDIDADKMLDVLRIGREKLSDKGTKSANKRVDPMRSQTGMAREDIIDSFLETFAERYDTRESDFTDDELRQAEELMRTKFTTDKWTHKVP
ncbi:lipoate--protein ligase family protein [Trueperella bialowiezensis]|uniref:Probable lipoate-protein ligase A n=1 Tax=Trueperella bialowiezensis TaxID=312285 RepID=A0A448PGF0_9ACTO|nr:biotin/lipoate A/B protein ligase family protein [Trueperella bialowiezensis]VEI13986.1 Probable lipoate-protein ligase A [Trueperella bialowiezensis]